MKLRVVQWNIGGGKIRDIDSDPIKTVGAITNSYSNEGLEYIIERLKEYSPDIITLEEAHEDSARIQAEVIAKSLGLDYWINDFYCNSHVEKGQKLCQAIISRFPLSDHSFDLFYNPHARFITEAGEEWISLDKGYSFVEAALPNDTRLGIGVLHAIPFRRFGLDYSGDDTQKILKNMEEVILKKRVFPMILGGDFNINDESLKTYFPNLMSKLDEIILTEPTNPKGRKYDHILFSGLKLNQFNIHSDTLTDHYPVSAEFEI
ncbi:MAG: hypothetical protein JWP09_455 [Candidatus Taylorbacteria bacterium]|nr:hypothetical protein [Candidatus Taylorbacteria bacterium]